MRSRTITWDRPKWTDPLIKPARYKGAPGGRARGASHFFASMLVLRCLEDPSLRAVCFREIQRSLRYSAKSLIEDKIRMFGLEDQFTILHSEIRRNGGSGVIIFEGLQDHTAESVKSLEGFGVAFFEEAQSISKRSLELALPTIRDPGSELWFPWNPSQPDDPVENLLRNSPPEDAVVVHATYRDNPFVSPEIVAQAERMKRVDPDAYAHIWLGKFDEKSDAKVFAGRYRVDEFDPGETWDGPYQGADFGFAQDPTTAVRFWLHDSRLFVEHESYQVQLELDRTAERWNRDIPGFADYVSRADSARPESISYLQRHGCPKIEGVKKWGGSVEDGVAWLKSREEIVIHPRCEHMIEEARLYSYKVDKRTGDILPKIVDAHNHLWDAIRYGAEPMIRVEEPFKMRMPAFPQVG